MRPGHAGSSGHFRLGSDWDPCYGPFASLKGSELWAPMLKVVHNDTMIGLQQLDVLRLLSCARPAELSLARSWYCGRGMRHETP